MSLPSPAQLRDASKVLKKQASALGTLARAAEKGAPAALEKALGAVRKAGTADVGALASSVQTWLADEKAGRADRLASGLREASAREGFELLVVARDPLELRLAPVAARVDLQAGKAEICFAREVLVRSDATAAGVLAARREAMALLEGKDWDARAWLGLLREAWVRAGGLQGSGWVELSDVLPEVALLGQSRAFRQDPVAKRFTPYPRCRFAYDLWRLRRDRTLAADGWRLSLGPATGGSARDKARVFWLEDDRGAGQLHLTLRFLREEQA